MARKDTDNLLKVIGIELTINAGTIVSREVDLELPRGFVAKIRKIVLYTRFVNEDIEGILTRETMAIEMVLVRDPDDITSIRIPDNEVQHDVLAMHTVDIIAGFDAVNNMTSMFMTTNIKILDLTELEDVITARNMRFNAVGAGADVADLTESKAMLDLYYTLEKVNDLEILDLLDIL